MEKYNFTIKLPSGITIESTSVPPVGNTVASPKINRVKYSPAFDEKDKDTNHNNGFGKRKNNASLNQEIESESIDNKQYNGPVTYGPNGQWMPPNNGLGNNINITIP